MPPSFARLDGSSERKYFVKCIGEGWIKLQVSFKKTDGRYFVIKFQVFIEETFTYVNLEDIFGHVVLFFKGTEIQIILDKIVFFIYHSLEIKISYTMARITSDNQNFRDLLDVTEGIENTSYMINLLSEGTGNFFEGIKFNPDITYKERITFLTEYVNNPKNKHFLRGNVGILKY